MRRTVIMILAMTLLFADCAQHLILPHPQTGQTVDCTALSMASPNPIQQHVDQRGCVTGHQAAGYVWETCNK